MKSKLEMVREFMTAFGQEVPDRPTLPIKKTRRLRHKLNVEESKELRDAKDLVEALDGIADLLYVANGAAVAYGFSVEMVNAAFQEVHRSNMSKMWSVREFNERTNSGEKLNINIAYASQHGRSGVVTDASGKVIKSPSYSPANLAPILEKFGKGEKR